MTNVRVQFVATGAVQTFRVPTDGNYRIEAAGAQGGAGAGPGHAGARLAGTFYLRAFELLKIVVGRRGLSGRVGVRGGDSLVWIGADLPQPIKVLVSARGGESGTVAGDAVAADAMQGRAVLPGLTLQWVSGLPAAAGAEPGDGAWIDGCGYNVGSSRRSWPGVQAGNGAVSIVALAADEASTSVGVEPAEAIPCQFVLPSVTSRPTSWRSLLRRPADLSPAR